MWPFTLFKKKPVVEPERKAPICTILLAANFADRKMQLIEYAVSKLATKKNFELSKGEFGNVQISVRFDFFGEPEVMTIAPVLSLDFVNRWLGGYDDGKVVETCLSKRIALTAALFTNAGCGSLFADHFGGLLVLFDDGYRSYGKIRFNKRQSKQFVS